MPKAKVKAVKKKPGDFKRPKRKVGKKAPKPSNFTSLSFKTKQINLLEQSALQEKGSFVTHRNLNLQDLLSKCCHYNGLVRKDALEGVQEIISHHSNYVDGNIALVLERTLPLLLDDESVVREAFLNMWSKLLHAVDGQSLKPFASLIVVYISSGMTHLQSGLRQDALKCITTLAEKCPQLISSADEKSLKCFILNFGDLLSSKVAQSVKCNTVYGDKKGNKGNTTKGIASISCSLSFRFSALKVLWTIFQVLLNEKQNSTTRNTTSSGTTPIPGNSMSFSSRMELLDGTSKRSLHLSTCDGTLLLYRIEPHATIPVGPTPLQIETLLFSFLPQLRDLWMECCPSDVSTLTDSYLDHMVMVVKLITMVLPFQHLICLDDLPLLRKLENEMFVHFPYKRSELSTNSGKTQGSWMDLNIAICEYVSAYDPVNHVATSLKKSSSYSSLTLIEEYMDTFKIFIIEQLEYLSKRPHPLTVEPILRVLGKLVQRVSQESKKDLLEAFSHFHMTCSGSSTSRRFCFLFIADLLEDRMALPLQNLEGLWVSEERMTTWVSSICQYLIEYGNGYVVVTSRLIHLLHSLAQRFSQNSWNGAMEEKLALFFSPETPNGFVALPLQVQDQAMSLVYYLKEIQQDLLKALASCCHSSQVDVSVKLYILEIIHHRRETIDFTAFLSFMMNILVSKKYQTEAPFDETIYQLGKKAMDSIRSLKLGSQLMQLFESVLLTYIEKPDEIQLHAVFAVVSCSIECLKYSQSQKLSDLLPGLITNLLASKQLSSSAGLNLISMLQEKCCFIVPVFRKLCELQQVDCLLVLLRSTVLREKLLDLKSHILDVLCAMVSSNSSTYSSLVESELMILYNNNKP